MTHEGPVAAPAAAAGKLDARADALATQAVIGNEFAADMERFSASLGALDADVDQGRDTTDHVIAAASAYNQLRQLNAADKPAPELQSKIERLKGALRDAKGNESLDSVAQKAHVDLSALNHHTDAASAYGKYGKAPSTYTRAFIFDEARFNNSALLKNTPLAAWQRPNQSVIDPLGPNGRLGILTGTRLNAAASYFTKGGQSFLSGMEKLRKGQDPTKDFITAGATTAQGINELTVGIGTDLGNHLVKLQQAKAALHARSPGGGAGGISGTGGTGSTGSTGDTGGSADRAVRPARARLGARRNRSPGQAMPRNTPISIRTASSMTRSNRSKRKRREISTINSRSSNKACAKASSQSSRTRIPTSSNWNYRTRRTISRPSTSKCRIWRSNSKVRRQMRPTTLTKISGTSTQKPRTSSPD